MATEEFGSLKSFYNDAVNLLSLGDDSGFGNESMSSDFAEDSDRYTISGQNIEKIGQGPPDTVRNTDDNDDPPYTPPDDVDLISDEEIFVTSKKKKKHISDSLAETIAYAKKRYQCDSSSEEEDLEDERLQQSSLNSSKKSVDSASICKSSNILKSKYTANGLKKLKADYPARRTNQNPILTESSSNSKSVNSGSNETRGNVEKSFIGSSSSDHNSLPVTDDKVLSELAAVNKTGSVRMKVDKEIESETQKVEKSFWQDSEVRTLLQIMNKAKVLHLIDHTGLTNKNIYAKVAKLFVQAGFNRTQKQIEAKWKHLKSIYQEAKSSMKPSGTGTKKRKDFRYYEEMDAILGNRPKNSLSGVDSYVPHVESQAKSDAEDVEDKENDENRQAEPNVSSQSKKSKKKTEHKTRQELLVEVMDDAVDKFEAKDNIFLDNMVSKMSAAQKIRDEENLCRFEKIQLNVVKEFFKELRELKSAPPPERTNPGTHSLVLNHHPTPQPSARINPLVTNHHPEPYFPNVPFVYPYYQNQSYPMDPSANSQ